MLFMGGLMVAAAIEHSQLHRRIALSILKLCGTNPRFLMLGRYLVTHVQRVNSLFFKLVCQIFAIW